MHLTDQERRTKLDKLDKLAEIEGFDCVDDLLKAVAVDSVSAGICTQPNCEYTCEVEPDQDNGWCEACGAPTVQSAMILAELV